MNWMGLKTTDSWQMSDETGEISAGSKKMMLFICETPIILLLTVKICMIWGERGFLVHENRD